MESKKYPSNKKLISIQEEKFIREFDYDSTAEASTCFPKKQLLLEILQKGTAFRQTPQKVYVSIKPRGPPIKTLYIAEKSRFNSKRSSDKSASRLAIGDHSSFATHFSEDNNIGNSISNSTRQETGHLGSDLSTDKNSSSNIQIKKHSSKCTSYDNTSSVDTRVYENNLRKTETKKCCKHNRSRLTMSNSKVVTNIEKDKNIPKKVDIATLVVTNLPSKDTFSTFSGVINKLNTRIDQLEHKILRQEMVFRTFDRNIPLSSSDEEKDNVMRTTSGIGRPGCSYIEQYSHIPETSAFQRYSQQGSPASPNKATTLEKEHNSEQYGRDFTAYDGITARGRRQSASVPCKRDDIPKVAAERVHKIRHKLNPVRDYRLMDTVHYLAQGEFAPRDDGIKLTPSREAVLSDIIWEDVCRTHWPNTRLGRRVVNPDRYSVRGELQRLIDNLLRERVAHVERRKRRHYRIVKLNNRHENCRPVGKTGDIIVASHKNKQDSHRDLKINDHKTSSAVMTDRRRGDKSPKRNHKSYERLILPGVPHSTRIHHQECSPGPSYASYSQSNRAPTNCYQTSTSNNNKHNTTSCRPEVYKKQELTSSSSMSANNTGARKPRLVVKKDISRRKSISKEEPNLEHFILLPTLVIRTPSNMKRQKKFNELYHRILNFHMNEAQNNSEAETGTELTTVPNKKDIGFNINITLSDSEENFTRK